MIQNVKYSQLVGPADPYARCTSVSPRNSLLIYEWSVGTVDTIYICTIIVHVFTVYSLLQCTWDVVKFHLMTVHEHSILYAFYVKIGSIVDDDICLLCSLPADSKPKSWISLIDWLEFLFRLYIAASSPGPPLSLSPTTVLKRYIFVLYVTLVPEYSSTL